MINGTPAHAVLDHLAWARHLNRRPGTLVQRRYHLERLATWLAGATPAATLLTASPEQLVEWQLSLEHLSAQTRATMIGHARAFYRWAIDRDLADHHLLRHLEAPTIPRRMPRPIPHSELVTALQEAPRRILPWLLIAAYAGLRACEIAPLRADDIDLRAGTLFVVEGKGGKQRMVTIGPELVALLRPMLPASGYLFPAMSRNGEPIPGTHVSAGQVSRLSCQYLRELGITSKLHALRHRYASDIWAATKDLQLLMELLGHASPSTVAIYTLIAPDRYAAAAAAISDGLGQIFARPRPAT